MLKFCEFKLLVRRDPAVANCCSAAHGPHIGKPTEMLDIVTEHIALGLARSETISL